MACRIGARERVRHDVEGKTGLVTHNEEAIGPHGDHRGVRQLMLTAGRDRSGILLLRASPKIPNTCIVHEPWTPLLLSARHPFSVAVIKAATNHCQVCQPTLPTWESHFYISLAE